MKITLFLALTVCLAAPFLSSGIIKVPNDFATIQEAIIAADNGDTIEVDSGTYAECIDFLGKSITVNGTKGAAVTVIDGGSPQPRSPVVQIVQTTGGTATISNFTIRNGTGLNVGSGEGTCGGGIFCSQALVTIDNNIIELNTTTSVNSQQANGGGIYCVDCVNGYSVLISNNTIRNNYAETRGGGIYCRNTEADITNNIISQNEACECGGGMFLGNNCDDVTVVWNEIWSNTVHGWGGGVAVFFSDPLVHFNSINYNTSTGIFVDPSWQGAGGGIHIEGATGFPASPTIYRNEIIGNSAYNTGGGIRTIHEGRPVIDANYIEGNIALNHGGGGIFCGGEDAYDDVPVVKNNIINNNTSAVFGGGLYLGDCGESSDPVIVMNNVISNNRTNDYHGGGILSINSWSRIINNTVVSNTVASGDGGGLYVTGTGGPFDVANCIFRDNVDLEAPIHNEIHPTTLNVTYSDVKGGYTGQGNIDADPLFFDAGRVDYHIQYDSPCRDAGDNGALPLDITVDFEHDSIPDPRRYPEAGTVDMGADEFNHAHLYFEVDATVPGLANVVNEQDVHMRVTGLPDPTLGVTLYVGVKLVTPVNWGAMGTQYVAATNPTYLGMMPSSGILSTKLKVPGQQFWPQGSMHYAQALVGPWNGGSSTLTINYITLVP